MRLASFGPVGKERLGIVQGDKIFDINDDMLSFIKNDRFAAFKNFKGENGVDLQDVRLGSPITNPGLIVCVGLNYKDHADEVGLDYPESPLLFSKAPSALCGPNDPIIYPENISKLDYEVELAVVIKKRAHKVKAQDALSYIAGYSVFHDVSARCAQFADNQWFRGKSFETFAPMGPFLVTPDECLDPNNLNLWCKVNGEIRQQSNTNKMFFGVFELIEYISHSMILSPGDIIATGTPAGVGAFSSPPKLLQRGDTIEMGVENLGEIFNKVI